MIIAETERIYIRNFNAADIDAIYSYRSTDEIARFQYWEPYTKKQTADFIEINKDSDINIRGSWNGFAIILKNKDKLIGDCSLKINVNSAEIGCNISPEYQKLGLAKEAVSLLLNIGFNLHNIDVIYGITDSENISSVKLMKSLGMTKLPEFEEKIICKGLPCIEHKYFIKKTDYSESL